ncbi:MAG: GAF domain-containing protein [Anaerolineae bacterium]|nr:GAF domain-containing protein [Anaerolineae bacterium]
MLLSPSRASAYYALVAASVVLVALALLHSRRSYLVRRWPAGASAALVPPALLAAHVAVLHVWPGSYAWMTGGAGLLVPVLVLVPVTVAAARTRPLEAALVGLTSSAAVALWYSHNPLTCLEGAYYGVFLSYLLTQSYRGRLFSLLRQPLLAAPLAALLTTPVTFLAAHSTTFGPPLTSLLAAWNQSLVAGATLIFQANLAGLLVQVLYLAGLRRPVPIASRVAPYSRSLRGQLLAAYVPTAGLALAAVLTLLGTSAISSATRWAFDEAARDASSAAQRLSRALEQGQEFLRLSLTDDDFADPARREQSLRLSLELHRDFSALLLTENGELVAAVTVSGEPVSLTPVEREALASLSPESAAVTTMHRDAEGPLITLISPEGPSGRLLGRMRPTRSQVWQDIIGDLQWTVDAGNGFVVDEQHRILAHPDPTYVLAVWDARPQYARVYATATGAAYDAPDSAGVRHLVYVLPVAGYPWQVVIEIPSEVVLGLALDLALPSLLLTIALAAIGTLLVLWWAWRYSQPLMRLAATASEIAAGDLSVAADVGGHDEIGHLGRSFEEMRLSLHRRLTDLLMLLDVSRSVSASYAWSFRPILRAAITGTQAAAACVCLDEPGPGQPVAREGDFDAWDDILPGMQPIAREARRHHRPIPVRSVARYFRGVSGKALATDVRSAICLPLAAGERDVGVMWVLYADRRHFDEQDYRLLSTLGAQAAVVYENSRLLTEAQSERGRLRAILASTSDPIVVADQEGRLVLANPAAERVLGLERSRKRTPARDVVRDPSLRMLLEMPLSQSCLTRELHLDSGATLSAAVSPITLDDGGSGGRVIVMRDVTELKQREQAQADFVANLSRDVRTPLTFLRGYASMIPRVGDLNSQQQDFVERIIRNVDHVSGMLDCLVDLNTIERGEGAHLERCSVAGAIEAALASLRPEIEKREHNIRLSLPPNPPLVEADRNLLIRALTALIDNSVKYTSKGGTIGIQVLHEQGGVLVAVSDTGIGIAPADQMRIFDRFYRVDRSEVQAVSGYGLGLPIVKAVADWHGGRVWVESELGRGSRFCLWLPRHEAPMGI